MTSKFDAPGGGDRYHFGLLQARRCAFCAALAGLALVTLIWLSTALLQAPRHGALGRSFDEGTVGELVRSNWIRTVAWSARGLLVLWMTARTIG